MPQSVAIRKIHCDKQITVTHRKLRARSGSRAHYGSNGKKGEFHFNFVFVGDETWTTRTRIVSEQGATEGLPIFHLEQRLCFASSCVSTSFPSRFSLNGTLDTINQELDTTFSRWRAKLGRVLQHGSRKPSCNFPHDMASPIES